jgi:hypothetical protein
MGQSLHINGIAQGRLKAGSSIRAGYQISKENLLLGLSIPPREEKKEAAEEAEPAAPPETTTTIEITSALKASPLTRKAS